MFNIYLAGSYQFDFENIPKSDIGIFSNRLISYEHPARERFKNNHRFKKGVGR